MLKSLGVVTVSIACVVVASVAEATAQDSGCYMITATGQTMNLENLCGGGVGQSAALSAPGQPPASGVFQVPIKRREGGIPVIDVTFNGTQTFEMHLDTGASVTTLTPQMAAALQVTSTKMIHVSTPTTRNAEMGIAQVASIAAGGAIVQNTEVAIAGAALQHGLLGESFAHHFDVTVRQNIVEFRTRE